MPLRLVMRSAMITPLARVISVASPNLRVNVLQVLARFGRPAGITTLAVSQLSASDFLAPAGKLRCALRRIDGVQTQIIYKSHVPFPVGTQGFLYYHPGPAYAPIAGEVRFRIVKSGRPEDFQSGKDLLQHAVPVPWSIPLVVIFQFLSYKRLAHVIKDCGIVSEDTLRAVRGGRPNMPIVTRNSRILHSIGQRIYFDVCQPVLIFARGNTLSAQERLSFLRIWTPQKNEFPYTGSMVCSFERAAGTEPARWHLRVHKIVNPFVTVDPNYDGHVSKPMEGELLLQGKVPWFIRRKEMENLPELQDDELEAQTWM